MRPWSNPHTTPFEPQQRSLPRHTWRARQACSAEAFPPWRRLPLPANGPEDVVCDHDGNAYCGLEDGTIVAINWPETTWRALCQLPGRPLGLEYSRHDNTLYACIANSGLWRIDPANGHAHCLVSSWRGRSLHFCSNVISADANTLYFTVSTTRYVLKDYRDDLLEHRGNGLLFRYQLGGKPELLLDGLHFANGLTLCPDQNSLIFAESGGFRLSKLQLNGTNAGAVRRIHENLPGFPDNLSSFVDGHFWVAMAAPRSHLYDVTARLPRPLARAANALPRALQPNAADTTWVMAFDTHGRIVTDWQTRGIGYGFVTGVAENSTHLFLASLNQRGLLAVAKPEVPAHLE